MSIHNRPCLGHSGPFAAVMAVLFSAVYVLAGDTTERHWTSCAYPASFEHLSVEHGLSQSTVHCILQDKKGFLWFGTDAGLNRYDGFRFQVFHPDKSNPTRSLTGDYINALMEDHRGNVWIATGEAGITILDPETLAMVPIYASEEPGGFAPGMIHMFAEDREGNIWIATETQGLCMVSKDWQRSGKLVFQTFQSSVQDPTGAPSRSVQSVFCDHDGTLWIACQERGLGRLVSNPGTGRLVFEYFRHDPTHPYSSSPKLITAIQEDEFGRLCLGGNNGPVTFDPARIQFKQWEASEGESIYAEGNIVREILRDHTGVMWAASDGSGLLKALPRARAEDPVRFQRFLHDPKDTRSLSGNGLQCVYEDRSGVLWVGDYQRGLNKLVFNPGRTQEREKPALFQYRNNAADPTTLSGNTVACIGEDPYGNLWVGTDGYGLNRVASPKPGQRMRFERFRGDPHGGPGSLLTDVILTTHLDAQKQLWLGSYNGGLIRVDQASAAAKPRFTHFRNNPQDPRSLANNFVRAIIDDGAGGLWVGLDGKGLNHFDPRTGKVKRYGVGDGPKAYTNAPIYKMVKDALGTLWIATSKGLNRFNPATEELRIYHPGGPKAPPQSLINTFYFDGASNLWLGTSGGTLYQMAIQPWDGPEPRFTPYGMQEGLPGSGIKNILPDASDNLWLSTDRALYRFNIPEGKAHPITWQGELNKAEFIWNACYRSACGELFFGSSDGLTLFHPEDMTPNKIVPTLAISGFQILNKSLPLESRVTQKNRGKEIQEITLHPQDSMISFDFAALHFAAPEKNQYAYRMEGLDQSWNEMENKHSISYAMLPPGRYVLRVQGSNCDGLWNREGLALRIHVLPPWYKTWWFRVLLLSSAVTVLLAGIRWYLSSLRRRNRFLEKAMAEQAQKLHEAEALNALNHLTETAASAGEDINHWVSEMAHEVCKAIDAVQIDVWEVSEENFLPITDTTEFPAASVQDLSRMDCAEVIPIRGPHGETLAALKVIGKTSQWTPLETQLLASFTHHLGGAYHLKWLRQTLVDARQQRSVDRKTLAAQGQGVLQLCPVCKRCYDEGPQTCPEDGTLLTSPRLLPFRFLGRYRLERLLGEGGTAHVFEAWDEHLARSVAVKAIKPNHVISEQTRERFAREASLLARLDHPGIVAIHDSRELEDGTLFLVMERLQGMTVGSMIRRYGPARPSQAAYMLRQVASALASTHVKGLVHRDLKPDNLFAMAGGEWIRYKVLDFGLAKGDVAETSFTRTGTLMGTPNYMSPEQARGQSVDWRSDLYSLAAIMYEALSGTPVIRTRVLAEIFMEVISRDPVPLGTLMKDCPPEVEALLIQGLKKNPRERPEELLAWAGRLDMTLQGWSRENTGWPNRCEDLDTADEIADIQTSEKIPSTLHP